MSDGFEQKIDRTTTEPCNISLEELDARLGVRLTEIDELIVEVDKAVDEAILATSVLHGLATRSNPR